MGLTGPSGVLPRHYTELLYPPGEGPSRGTPRNTPSATGSTCSITGWCRCSTAPGRNTAFFLPYERGESRRPDPDLFTACLFSLVGLGARPLRNRLSVAVREVVDEGEAQEPGPGRIENLALLRYSGLLAQQMRSAVGLQAMLQDYFSSPGEVRQYPGQWLRIEPSNQTRLGDRREQPARAHDRGRGAGLGHPEQVPAPPRPDGLRSVPRFPAGSHGRFPSARHCTCSFTWYASTSGRRSISIFSSCSKGPRFPNASSRTGRASAARLGWNTWLRGRRVRSTTPTTPSSRAPKSSGSEATMVNQSVNECRDPGRGLPIVSSMRIQ